jgi:hypothetical protein
MPQHPYPPETGEIKKKKKLLSHPPLKKLLSHPPQLGSGPVNHPSRSLWAVGIKYILFVTSL